MEIFERLIYINQKAEEIELSLTSVYTLNAINGRNNIEFTREVVLQGKIFSMSNERQTLTQYLLKVFNPYAQGTLRYENDVLGIKRYLDCRVTDIQTSTKNNLIHFAINLDSKTPWREQEKAENIAVFTPMFHFPLIIPQVKGICMGNKLSALEAMIDNTTDIPAGFKAKIIASNGTVTNPSITNKNKGTTIKINYPMAKKDIIEIISTEQEKKVFLNGENAFKYIDIDTEFFTLDIGQNIIGYNADLNTINMEVILYYTPYYLHV